MIDGRPFGSHRLHRFLRRHATYNPDEGRKQAGGRGDEAAGGALVLRGEGAEGGGEIEQPLLGERVAVEAGGDEGQVAGLRLLVGEGPEAAHDDVEQPGGGRLDEVGEEELAGEVVGPVHGEEAEDGGAGALHGPAGAGEERRGGLEGDDEGGLVGDVHDGERVAVEGSAERAFELVELDEVSGLQVVAGGREAIGHGCDERMGAQR